MFLITILRGLPYLLDKNSVQNLPNVTFVQVKCVVGGNKLHSRLIPGEVCTLKLTHQDMATQLLNPRSVSH